tara:strand:+ start:39692 stop:40564 length:873 start_codon:yes stop_codon:yes gene_type:complete
MNIINDIHQSYKKGDLLSKLIYLNLFVFLFYKVLATLFFLFSIQNTSIISWLALSSDFNSLLTKPWTIISHMFYHQGFIHLTFNLIGLYFYGKIFSQYLNSKQLVSTYVIGGLFGALFYYLSFNYLEAFDSSNKSFAFGASAAVLAILTAISTYTPNYRVTIPLVAKFELKYIAIAFIIIDIILIPSSNGGGHIAHLGGAFYGFYFGHRLKQGKDISIWFNNLMDSIVNYFRKDPNLKTVHKRAKTDDAWRNEKKQSQDQINIILEKISKSGYESLNDKEKEILFKESKK